MRYKGIDFIGFPGGFLIGKLF